MKKYTDLKTFTGACKVLGLDPKTVIPNFSCYPKQDRKSMEAHAKLVIIVRAANKLENGGEEWFPNWKDTSEYKYEVWFNMNDSSSASGFSYDGYADWYSLSCVGSRLCFKNRDLGKFIAKQFLKQYEAYFT